MPKIDQSKLRKTEKMVLRDQKNNDVKNVIFPNGIQVGLDTDGFNFGIKLPNRDTAPSKTSNALYAIDGDIYFNGALVGQSGTLSIANGGTNNSSAYTSGRVIYSDGTSLVADPGLFWDDDSRSLGVAISPTARMHLASGTAAASTAPLKLETGVLMTTPEAGSIEYLTDTPYFTIATGEARKQIVLTDDASGLTTGRVPFGTTAGRLLDAAKLFWDNATAKLGIGHGAPIRDVHVKYESASGSSHLIPTITVENTRAYGAFSFATFEMIGGNGAMVGNVFADGRGYFLGGGRHSFYFRTNTSSPIVFGTNLTIRMLISETGNIGIGQNVPTARLHIAAGSTAASSAPIKLTSGAVMTTAEAGAIEFLTDDLYVTITTGAARKRIALTGDPVTMPVTSTSTTPYDIRASDAVILVDATAGGIAVNLPVMVEGRVIHVKKTDSSGNAVIVTPQGGDTIDGAATSSLAAQYDMIHLVAGPGTDWSEL